MALTENERKERTGKIACAFFIGIPLIIFVGYFLFFMIIGIQFGNSLKETSEKIFEAQHEKTIKREKKFLYREILAKNKSANFTGISQRNDSTFTNALLIKAINSSVIEYRIESLINWKSQNELKGLAILDTSSIGSHKWDIQNSEGIWKPAFRFIEAKDDCLIEILITKKNYSKSLAIAKEICNDKTKVLTVKMRYK